MRSGYEYELDKLRSMGRTRSLIPRNSRSFILDLSSNDYLGIGKNLQMQEEFWAAKATAGAAEYGLASSSSRLLTGDCELAHQLEEEIAEAYDSETALLLNSGYHANIGILPALMGRNDLILSDKLNHASIHDGLHLSRGACKRYRHADYEHLEFLLQKHGKEYEKIIIVSESVFSMDGDSADILKLVDIKKKYGAMLYVDEAHGVGVYGDHGLGKVEEAGCLRDVDLLVGTFGKAWASVGAFVCCSRIIRDYLVNRCRSLIFTTALPPVTINWNLFVFRRSLQMSAARKHLHDVSRKFRDSLRKNGIRTAGETNIIPVFIGADEPAVRAAEKIRRYGYLVLPVRPPAVPENTARFRLSLNADMGWGDLAEFLEILKKNLS